MNLTIQFESHDPRLQRRPQEIYHNCPYYGQALADFLHQEFTALGLPAIKTGKRTLTVQPEPKHGIDHQVHLKCVSGLPVRFNAAGHSLGSAGNGRIHKLTLIILPLRRLPFWALRRKKLDRLARHQTGQRLATPIHAIIGNPIAPIDGWQHHS